VDPLFVAGELGKRGDVLLGDGSPAADPQVGAQPFLQACQTVQNERSTTRRLGGGRFAHLFVLQFVFPVGRCFGGAFLRSCGAHLASGVKHRPERERVGEALFPTQWERKIARRQEGPVDRG